VCGVSRCFQVRDGDVERSMACCGDGVASISAATHGNFLISPKAMHNVPTAVGPIRDDSLQGVSRVVGFAIGERPQVTRRNVEMSNFEPFPVETSIYHMV